MHPLLIRKKDLMVDNRLALSPSQAHGLIPRKSSSGVMVRPLSFHFIIFWEPPRAVYPSLPSDLARANTLLTRWGISLSVSQLVVWPEMWSQTMFINVKKLLVRLVSIFLYPWPLAWWYSPATDVLSDLFPKTKSTWLPKRPKDVDPPKKNPTVAVDSHLWSRIPRRRRPKTQVSVPHSEYFTVALLRYHPYWSFILPDPHSLVFCRESAGSKTMKCETMVRPASKSLSKIYQCIATWKYTDQW